MFEIGGEGYSKLTYEEASKVFNAVTEFGGIGAVGFEKNTQVIKYLRGNGSNLDGVTEEEIDKIYTQMRPDDGATYKHIVHYDLGSSVPALVGPQTHKKVIYLNVLTKKVNIDRVIYNSCAGSSIFDLAVLAQILSDEKRKIPVDVHLADPLTRIQAEKLGILYELGLSGVMIDVKHSCGPCMGQGAFVKKGETVLSTNNRNYPGRMGDENAKVYLSSSIVAALTAKLGRVPSLDEVKRAEASVFRARELVYS
jgi:3-isopropylmalate/(R)-2-methylmalate dehydratase large subunit